MSYANLAIVALFIFFYSVLSRRVARTPFNGALVFTFAGFVLGSYGLGLLDLDIDSDGLRILAESALALLLFTEAAGANLNVLRQAIAIPRRLLLLVLPLKILMGYLCGLMLFDDLSHFEIAVLATLLAPTDAALGKAVVTNPAVPDYIRESLNVESGLNDGLCVPILFVFLALATGAAAPDTTAELALELTLGELGTGLAVGLSMTAAMAVIMSASAVNGWITETWRELPVIGMALSCFGVAQWLDGSGFIAAFSGGLLFGWISRRLKHEYLPAAEGAGDTLALLTWVVFGAVVIGKLFHEVTWQVVLYAVLSLTVVRILPVLLCLTGTRATWREKLFMGWFGPRGLASIVFAVVVLNQNLPGGDIIIVTAACTILFSVVAHGITANPLIHMLRKHESRAKP